MSYEFLGRVNNFYMVFLITIGIFLTTRYVLLEPAMEAKKQRIFYIFSFSVIFLYTLLFEINGNFPLIFGVANIILGRKKHRLLGALLIIPVIGIINGLATPILMCLIIAKDDNAALLASFILYTVVSLILLIFFYIKGKNWRIWFRDNMKNRKPLTIEYIVLWVSGVMLTVLTSGFSNPLETLKQLPDDVGKNMRAIYVFALCVAFTLAVTVIVLIMQGNKRKFYHDQVSAMQFNVIATMADIVEDRDTSTGGHIKRTAKYVEIIGETLQKQNAFPDILTEQYLADMIVAAPLHDIGKIMVPDAILNKPGRLTDEEFAIMKKHAAAGRDVLMKAKSQLGEFNYLNVAVDMAEYHHEWYNGNGYPNGTKGEEIPLCARIMAIADVFDALTSKRCYKEAMPVEKAYSIIEEEIGTHFDPVAAEAFLSSKDRIEEALTSLRDEMA